MDDMLKYQKNSQKSQKDSEMIEKLEEEKRNKHSSSDALNPTEKMMLRRPWNFSSDDLAQQNSSNRVQIEDQKRDSIDGLGLGLKEVSITKEQAQQMESELKKQEKLETDLKEINRTLSRHNNFLKKKEEHRTFRREWEEEEKAAETTLKKCDDHIGEMQREIGGSITNLSKNISLGKKILELYELKSKINARFYQLEKKDTKLREGIKELSEDELSKEELEALKARKHQILDSLDPLGMRRDELDPQPGE